MSASTTFWSAARSGYVRELAGCSLHVEARPGGGDWPYRFRVESRHGWGWRQGERETLEEAMQAAVNAAEEMLPPPLEGADEAVA